MPVNKGAIAVGVIAIGVTIFALTRKAGAATTQTIELKAVRF